MIGMSKQHLDEFLIVIRIGRKFNYDFENNQNTKLQVLEEFVNEAR